MKVKSSYYGRVLCTIALFAVVGLISSAVMPKEKFGLWRFLPGVLVAIAAPHMGLSVLPGEDDFIKPDSVKNAWDAIDPAACHCFIDRDEATGKFRLYCTVGSKKVYCHNPATAERTSQKRWYDFSDGHPCRDLLRGHDTLDIAHQERVLKAHGEWIEPLPAIMLFDSAIEALQAYMGKVYSTTDVPSGLLLPDDEQEVFPVEDLARWWLELRYFDERLRGSHG